MLWWGLKAAAWLVVQNTDYIKLTAFPSDRIQQLQLRPVGSAAHRSLQLSSVQSWMDGPTAWIQSTFGPLSHTGVRAGYTLTVFILKPAAFTTADVHLESTVAAEKDAAWDSFSFLQFHFAAAPADGCSDESSYLSPDWFLCFQARNVFNLCYKTKTNHGLAEALTSQLFAILWKGSDCVQLSHFLLCPGSAALLTSSDSFLCFLEFTDALWQLESQTLRCLMSAASDSLRFLFPQSDARLLLSGWSTKVRTMASPLTRWWPALGTWAQPGR